MQKIKYLLLVAMLVVCGSASAQFSNTTKTTSASPAVGGQQKGVDGWNTFFIEYAPTKFNYDYDVDDDYELSMNTLSFGWRKAFGVSQKVPLYIETGLGLSYSFGKLGEDDYEQKYNLLSFNIPINIGYNFSLADGKVDLAPYFGIDLRINALGKMKVKEGYYDFDFDDFDDFDFDDYMSRSSYYDDYDDDDDDDDDKALNLFDKKDMGSKDATWKRFQAGWRLGLNATFSQKFTVGVSYGSDFTEISKKVKTSAFRITAGIRF